MSFLRIPDSLKFHPGNVTSPASSVAQWGHASWAIMAEVIALPGNNTLAKCIKKAIYWELDGVRQADARKVLVTRILGFLEEGLRLVGLLGGEDPTFLPLVMSFVNVRNQLRRETADGSVLDANRWRASCEQMDLDFSLQPQELTMAVLAHTNDQSSWLFSMRSVLTSEQFGELATNYLSVNAQVLRMVEMTHLKPVVAGLNSLTFAAFCLANSLAEGEYPLQDAEHH